MLAVGEITLDDRDVGLVAEEAAEQPIEERGEARDPGGEQDAAGLGLPPSLAERHDPVRLLRQVIERAQQQHGVGARVRPLEPPRVADARTRELAPGLAARSNARLIDMHRARIDQVHLVAERGEPARVDTRTAADVEHGAPRRQMAQDDLLGTRELDLAGAAQEASRLTGLPVVRDDLGREWLGIHGPP